MTQELAWALLITAGFLDVLWAVSMKYAEGYTRLGWSIISLALLAGFIVLGRSLQVLPTGTAYAVWTGVGAVGTVLMGVALFGEIARTAPPVRHRSSGGGHRHPQDRARISVPCRREHDQTC